MRHLSHVADPSELVYSPPTSLLHLRQLTAPGSEVKWPEEHASHSLLPVLGLCRPIVQFCEEGEGRFARE